MFGHKKAQPVSETTQTTAPQEAVHQFDQTNGIMKSYDEYQSRKHGIDPMAYDSGEQAEKLFESGAIGGMLGGSM